MNYTPRLMDLNTEFGNGTSSSWIKKQVLSLWTITPDTNTAVGVQADMWSKGFAARNKTRTLGELMVFFGRCMVGHYSCGYTFDLTRLGNAFERFKEEWYNETAYYQEQIEKAVRQKQSVEEKMHSMTRAEYCAKYGIVEKENPLEALLDKARKESHR